MVLPEVSIINLIAPNVPPSSTESFLFIENGYKKCGPTLINEVIIMWTMPKFAISQGHLKFFFEIHMKVEL